MIGYGTWQSVAALNAEHLLEVLTFSSRFPFTMFHFLFLLPLVTAPSLSGFSPFPKT